MATRHDSNGSASTRSTQRPDSRASTTSALSQHDGHDIRHEGPAWSPQSAMLMQLQARMDLPHQHLMHQHPHYPPQGHNQQEPMYMHDATYVQQLRPGSVPLPSGIDMHDERRRKSSGVTASNDKELREMLTRNEGRPLRDVAQEVIQKERTPMAEKTKQLFAMLWYGLSFLPYNT